MKLFARAQNSFQGKASLLLAANRILIHAVLAGAVCTAIVILL